MLAASQLAASSWPFQPVTLFKEGFFFLGAVLLLIEPAVPTWLGVTVRHLIDQSHDHADGSAAAAALTCIQQYDWLAAQSDMLQGCTCKVWGRHITCRISR